MKPPACNFSALTTDLYEVTMACGYWKAGVSDYEAAFHVTFRENPFGGQFTVACGLATAIDFLRGLLSNRQAWHANAQQARSRKRA